MNTPCYRGHGSSIQRCTPRLQGKGLIIIRQTHSHSFSRITTGAGVSYRICRRMPIFLHIGLATGFFDSKRIHDYKVAIV